MPEAGKVYKVNNASLCKVLSVDNNIAIVVAWPPRPGRKECRQALTCGPDSNNYFKETGKW